MGSLYSFKNVIFEMSEENVSSNNDCKSTPPTNRKVRNPFDKVLIERLHKPLCSPGMCKIYKKRNSSSFRWDIDQACTLIPADIVVCNSQFEPSPDPALERIANEATDQFFSQMVVPSPLESSKKVKPLMIGNNANIEVMSVTKEVIMRDVSAQTVLTLPPVLPPEIQKVLEPFCTFTQDQDISGEYEITANGSLRRKLLFIEELSDMEQYDSEQTDDEIHIEQRPPSRYDAHTPIIFSPDLSRDLVTKGMKRTFGTPLRTGSSTSNKPGYRNKILDVMDFGESCFSPIHFKTPKHADDGSTTSSFASNSISPVNKVLSSDEEKNNFTSPESDAMATCLDCITTEPEVEKKGACFCKTTPNKYALRRSASLKDSPPRNKKGSVSFSEKRSLSMSSLNRSRSVQKLDFSMDMSIDGSFHDNCQDNTESTPQQIQEATWSIVEETNIQQIINLESNNESSELQSTHRGSDGINILDKTPVKTKSKSNVLTHEISRIRAPLPVHDMSLDNSLDENPLHLEDKKIDFNTVDLKFLTENISDYEYANATKVRGDTSTSFKRIDSGFNENTFYGNASSYYESAIKPSELTVTNNSKTNKTALKEISNVNWMRVDSGFKEENSGDSMQFYHSTDNSIKKTTRSHFTEAKSEDKENIGEDFDRFLVQNSNKNDAMSMSDIFTEDMTFNCNFSSTPSKNKSRKAHS